MSDSPAQRKSGDRRKAADAVDTAVLMSAVSTLLTPPPATDLLFAPWPSPPTPEFLRQRAEYLRFIQSQRNAIAGILECENGRYQARRKRSFSATRRLRAQIIARDRSICGICGEYVAPAEVTIDHIIPVVRGGSDEPNNLQVAHGSCNSRKGARVPEGSDAE